MQAVQAAIIAATALQATDTFCAHAHTPTIAGGRDSNGSSGSSGSSGGGSEQCCRMLLDRTERLANSLGKMVWVVQQLNEMDHGLSIMLMAGGCC
jgi:hypothetical protein